MICFFIAIIFIAAVLTFAIRQYAIKNSLLDIPNQRSSHDQPIPRGGGLAIVLIVLAVVAMTGLFDQLSQNKTIALLGGGGLVALIGWIDDHKHISATLRMIVHFLAAIWTVYWLGGFNEVDLGFMMMRLGWIGSVLAILGMVWLINLYNFMDGADGFASIQTIAVGSFVIFLFLSAGNAGLVLITLAMVAATTGFLLWNWSPAKIFMGDVGSSFLGYFIASLAMMGEKNGSAPMLIWAILLAPFFWDATLTLIRRVLAGEKWYEAHCSHVYQQYLQQGNSHGKLALWFCVINVTILWPAALVAWNYQLLMSVIALIASALTIGLWLTMKWGFNKRGK